MIKSAALVDIEERRMRAAGCFSSGLHDLFEEHDKYLIEAFENMLSA